ncbi:MAG: hypothetical protein JJU28_19270 [Cyclobacteriaceae bacterium]|nr:hypothetical protein [Cyclobacteriaceae bacterium]
MEKLTLSIRDREKITWIKNFAKTHDISVSQLFENYVEALRKFDEMEVKINPRLQSLRQPGKRPTDKQIDIYLQQRRRRSFSKSKNS